MSSNLSNASGKVASGAIALAEPAHAEAQSVPATPSAFRQWLRLHARNLGLALTLVISVAVIGAMRPHFLSANNLLVVAMNMSFIGIAAIGTAYLVISGSVDLSIGSLFALVGVAASMLATVAPPYVAIPAGIALGGAVGLINGAMTWRIKISPLIITLGSMAILRGVVLLLTGGFAVRGVPKDFAALGQSRLAEIPTPIWLFALLCLAAHIVLTRTTTGLHIIARGGNRDACEAVGISVKRLTLGAFFANGLIVGLAGVLNASRFGTASPSFGIGLELDVITAVILGGVAFTGGEGSIPGVVLAVALLGVINSGIVALGINPDYAEIVKGAALIGAVSLDQFSHEAHARYRKMLAMRERA
jgi:ribose/xylose/arabinose/galactoside ABC-type transport system permease subunit